MDKNPVEPARTLVTLLGAMAAAGCGMMIVAAVRGSHATCAESPALGQMFDEAPRAGVDVQLGDGVLSDAHVMRLCAEDPTAWQRVLALVVDMSSLLVLLATLLLAIGMFRVVDNRGLFSARAAAWMRLVGWVVLAGNLLADLLVVTASSALLDTMLVRHPFGDGMWLSQLQLSFTPIVLGIVLISLARVLRVSTRMREDLEGTV